MANKLKKNLYLFLLMAFALPLMACSNGGSDSNKVPFESIMSKAYSSVDVSKEMIINSNDEYMKLMNEVYAFLDQMPVVPEVDFTKNTVIAIFLGPRANGGYSVSVDKITETSELMNVYITENAPGKNCVTTDVITKPFELVKIPKTNKMAVFKYKKVTKDCQ